jgi:hypothetical protein
MNCTALAALPITPTRSPARSWSQSQRAEWNLVPANESRPGMSGQLSSLNMPRPATTTSNSKVSPGAVSTRQTARASSHTADVTSVSKRMRSRNANRSTTSSMYAWISSRDP